MSHSQLSLQCAEILSSLAHIIITSSPLSPIFVRPSHPVKFLQMAPFLGKVVMHLPDPEGVDLWYVICTHISSSIACFVLRAFVY